MDAVIATEKKTGEVVQSTHYQKSFRRVVDTTGIRF
jgi:hypothetical protein